MRRRDRWRNLVWLHWMDGDTGEGAVPDFKSPVQPLTLSMETLILAYRRYVDFEQLGEGYRIRVIPALGAEENGPLAFGMCYAGTCLGRILATAVVELDLIAGGQTAFRVGVTERWRWISC